MKTKLYSLFILFSIPLLSQTQSLERSLVSSCGQSFQGTSFSMEYSVGEAVITTLSSPNLILLQGFQQPTGIGDFIIEPEKLELSLYPNPGRTIFHFSMPLDEPSDVRMEVVNVLGQTIWSHVNQAPGGGVFSVDLDLGSIATGTYTLRVISGSRIGNLQFVKVSM